MTTTQKIKNNWKSGLTVALVSIPLSISLAIASGVSPIVGIITAIWAGLFASVFGGSHFNIVGPTGALSGLILSYVLANGTETVGMLALITGVFVLIAYFLKLERYLVLIPSSVIHGFTLGVAFIIAFGQLNFALGLSGLEKHERLFENIIESFKHLAQFSGPTVILFLLSMASLIILKKIVKKIPGAIIIAPIGILIGYLQNAGKFDFGLKVLSDTVVGGLDAKIFMPFHFSFSTTLLTAGITMAIVAILETMLSARIGDAMTKTKHDERKEMLGLSLANIASGLAGGIPATAALARTSLNIKSGADDRTSAITSSLLIIIISLVLFKFFRFLPMAIVAAILADVAIKMVEAHHFVRFFQYDKKAFYISLIVAFITVYEDPIMGILIGAVIALLMFVEKLSHGQFEMIANKTGVGKIETVIGEKISEIAENPDILLYSFKGKLIYLNCRAHIARFESNLSKYKSVILRLREVYFMDLDGVDALDEIIDLIEAKGQTVVLCSIDPSIRSFLYTTSKKFKVLEGRGLVFEKATYALEHLGVPARK